MTDDIVQAHDHRNSSPAGGVGRRALFNYSVLDNQTAALARETAERIRRHEKATVEIGTALLHLKKSLGHGNFLKWIGYEFGWSARTAQRYMMVAEAFAGKYDIVSDLPSPIVYKLAAPSTPAPLRQQIVERIEGGELFTHAQINSLISNGQARHSEPRQAEAAEQAYAEPAVAVRERKAPKKPKIKPTPRRVTHGQPVVGLEGARRFYLDCCAAPGVNLDTELEIIVEALKELAGKRTMARQTEVAS
jgi:hypothetical protein